MKDKPTKPGEKLLRVNWWEESSGLHPETKPKIPEESFSSTRAASSYSKTGYHTQDKKKAGKPGIDSHDWRTSRTPDTSNISKFGSHSYEPRDEKPPGDRWIPSGKRWEPSGTPRTPGDSKSSGKTWRKKYLKYKEKYLKLKLELDL
jgi:hypothetical protein